MSNERRQRPFARRRDTRAPTAQEVDALENELRALPELEAPSAVGARVRERLDQESAVDDAPSHGHGRRQTTLALAASIALVGVAAVVLSVHISTGDLAPAGNTGIAIENGTTRQATEPLDHAAVIEALMEQSRLAEERRRAVLAFYSPSGPEELIRAQIGGIDATLNEQMFVGRIDPRSREALLRDRVELMADLTDIERYRQHEFVRQVSF